ncbi:hypothetical protein CLV46_2847 [Diaminobutyricimonas aerilata]|uniref:Uncharacterized protein n=1 Tax=Diaminobutyricimonas aerilata TaxID=1162967 RepID=A0A2M9CMZ0_9MICO|nr:hypothetical protein [Diaminobutyricimonas aerilata]PJJ73261.1 hypothetical protein CLV46_2847 [Diaminobutyricimonas aerilata]
MDMTEYGYRLIADPATWVPVPREFPFGEWVDADAWLADVPSRLAAGVTDAGEIAEWYRRTASAVLDVPAPHAGVQETFWYLPLDRLETTLAHLSVVPRAVIGEATLEDIATTGAETVMAPRIERIPSRVFGEAVRALETLPARIDDADGGTGVGILGVARLAAESHGAIFLIEVIDPSLDRIALMLDDLLGLLDSIRIGTIDELERDPASPV